jgi:ABC-2 type transport system permease protein
VPGLPGQIKVIFTEEFQRNINRRSYRIMTLAVPVIMLLLLIAVPVIRGVIQGRPDQEPQPIGLLDGTGQISPHLQDEPRLQLFPEREAGVEALLAGDIQDFFIVPEDYLGTGRVEWLSTDQGLPGSNLNNEQVRSWLQSALLAEYVPPERASLIMSPARFERIELDPDGTPDTREIEFGRTVLPVVFGIMLIMGIVVGGSNLLNSVGEEKESRVIEVILTSATPLAVMAGKVLALGTTGLLQLAVWIGSVVVLGPLVFQQLPDAGALQVPLGLLVSVLGFFLAGYFVFAVIMAGIGAATTSTKEASQFSTLVTLPSFVPIWALQFIIVEPDGAFARVLSFIPITAPVTMGNHDGTNGRVRCFTAGGGSQPDSAGP